MERASLQLRDGPSPTDTSDPLTTFEGRITDAQLATGTTEFDDSLSLVNDGAAATLSGELFPDGSWETTAVSWPPIDPDVDVPPGVDFAVDIGVDGPLAGTIAPDEGAMTASLSLRAVVDVTILVKSLQVEIPVEATALTTGESGALTGSASGLETAVGLDGESAAVELVDNEFTVPATGTDAIDEQFGLPATEPGTNWLTLEMELDLADPVEAVPTD